METTGNSPSEERFSATEYSARMCPAEADGKEPRAVWVFSCVGVFWLWLISECSQKKKRKRLKGERKQTSQTQAMGISSYHSSHVVFFHSDTQRHKYVTTKTRTSRRRR